MRLPEINMEESTGQEPRWLRIGVTGFSGAGKTKSALEIATGIRAVTGGEIGFIDTELGRGAHYKPPYEFRHFNFKPPYSPLCYLAAINRVALAGCSIIIVDSMTHEHSGQGGVLEQIDQYLDEKCGEDQGARDRNNMAANVVPKKQRRVLNDRIKHLPAHMILCYQAENKSKPVTGRGIVEQGWLPDTTSKIVYDMTVRFLLEPGAAGRPKIDGGTAGEKMVIKSPEYMTQFFPKGEFRLDQELGRRMAEWAVGDSPAQKLDASAAQRPRGGGVTTETIVARAKREHWSTCPECAFTIVSLPLKDGRVGVYNADARAHDTTCKANKPSGWDEYFAAKEAAERETDEDDGDPLGGEA